MTLTSHQIFTFFKCKYPSWCKVNTLHKIDLVPMGVPGPCHSCCSYPMCHLYLLMSDHALCSYSCLLHPLIPSFTHHTCLCLFHCLVPSLMPLSYHLFIVHFMSYLDQTAHFLINLHATCTSDVIFVRQS